MLLLKNKNAKREYEIIKTYTAGLLLDGAEVKSLRQKKGSLKGSFVKILDGEAFLINAQVNPYEYADNRDYDPKRTRKLLLKQKEIDQMGEATKKKNITLVPLAIITVGKYIKLEVGIGRGKKEFEKRQDLKNRAIRRDAERELKNKVRFS